MNKKVMVIFLCVLFNTLVFSDAIFNTNQIVEEMSFPILKSIVDNLYSGDYQNYIKDFDEKSKSIVTEQMFKETKTKMISRVGNIKSLSFLGFLNQKQLTLVLFKATYSKINDECLIKLYLNNNNGKIEVAGLWFE